MDEEEFLARIARLPILSADLREEAWRRQRNLVMNRMRQRVFAYTGPTRDTYCINGTEWRSRSAGAAALAHAVRNPARWLLLPGNRSIKAWHATVSLVIHQIDAIDIGLADALAIRRGRAGSGTHLRTAGTRVELWWSPSEIAVSAQPPALA